MREKGTKESGVHIFQPAKETMFRNAIYYPLHWMNTTQVNSPNTSTPPQRGTWRWNPWASPQHCPLGTTWPWCGWPASSGLQPPASLAGPEQIGSQVKDKTSTQFKPWSSNTFSTRKQGKKSRNIEFCFLIPNREHTVRILLLYLDNGHVNHSEVPKSWIFQEFPPERGSISKSKIAHQEE